MSKLKRIYGYRTIDEIIADHKYQESDSTNSILNECSSLSDLSPFLLYKICHWKAARSSHHVRTNADAYIRKVVQLADQADDCVLKAHTLTALTGINLPTASAVLMFTCPQKYPVIDTRVWQLLFDYKIVTTNKDGKAFTLQHWDQYLAVIRALAKEKKKTARQVEKCFFDVHQRNLTISRKI